VIAYLDSSVLLRIVLEQPGTLGEWHDLTVGIASPLLAVECYRTLERFWRLDQYDDETYAAKREDTATFLRRFDMVALDEQVLRIAEQPFPTIIRTLDAIHLASALAYRAAQPPDERPLLFATHDSQLARAARAMNFEVIGA
jgi:predicted nucleic acid-binding protein